MSVEVEVPSSASPSASAMAAEGTENGSADVIDVGVDVDVDVIDADDVDVIDDADADDDDDDDDADNADDEKYRCLVVDSGPIIKHTGIRNLFGKAEMFVTVPGVIDEIRDAKARQHLEQWPMELNVKTPTPESIQTVIAFSKQTGDYASLSKIDLEVLALVLDMEKEGCHNNIQHIRNTPKRMIGLGSIQSLKNNNNNNNNSNNVDEQPNQTEQGQTQIQAQTQSEPSAKPETSTNTNTNTPIAATLTNVTTKTTTTTTNAAPKSWAMLVNPSEASKSLPQLTQSTSTTTYQLAIPKSNVNNNNDDEGDDDDSNNGIGGQFSDADESEDGDNDQEDEDEEENNDDDVDDIQAELEMEFPSLAAAATVPYEGSDDEGENEHENKVKNSAKVKPTDEAILIQKKMQALQPISKSGKLYNSFRKYGKLMKPVPPKKKNDKESQSKEEQTNFDHFQSQQHDNSYENNNNSNNNNNQQSRILGAGAAAAAVMATDDMGWEEDDGEGWITCKSDIRAIASNGAKLGADPKKLNANRNNDDAAAAAAAGPVGPPKSKRTACTTTDFAMQNVLLQMGLALLSVDGVQIRRVKSWVYRCGACFKIHTDAEFKGMKRLFCSHCGSDMMQRIAASVDGKTGRLKLHLSKRYKHNLRGTKFSLPKPGNGNRFQGDLLLREDQLLTGAWNQKVKIRTGGKSRANAQSIFGKDLASNVGCDTKLLTTDDLRVGFGRRNPNAAKGRERRGKKKKSSDRACGLRRY